MGVTVRKRRLRTPSALAEVDPLHARDLIVERFSEIQQGAPARSEEPSDASPDHIRTQAQDAIRDAFEWTGGDYDNPNKASLVRVLGSLAEIASLLGVPQEIVEFHTQEIVTVLRELPD